MRGHRAACGADESMSAHRVERRIPPSQSLHGKTFLPPRPRSSRDTGILFRRSELLGLQVQGFCCPLQQRPSSGRYLHRATPESRGGGSGSMYVLSDLKGGLQSREKLHSRTEIRPDGDAPALNNPTRPVAKATETPSHLCDSQQQAHNMKPCTTKVSELHLYLPSSQRDDEEQNPSTEDMSISTPESSTAGSEVIPNTNFSL